MRLGSAGLDSYAAMAQEHSHWAAPTYVFCLNPICMECHLRLFPCGFRDEWLSKTSKCMEAKRIKRSNETDKQVTEHE